jgi:nuclear pore complex protein Nup62
VPYFASCWLPHCLITASSCVFATLSRRSLRHEKAQFEVALRRYLNTHSFYYVDEFFMFDNFADHVFSVALCFVCFVSLWLIAHPTVVLANFWFHGMHISMCVYICVFVYVCMPLCIYVYVCVFMYVFMYVCVCMYVCMRVCMCL